MNCTLTIKQQKLLFGKIGIDLKNMPVFSFDNYAKTFHDFILSKTNDKVLAANYVALLPMNIRAVMGVDKNIFKKLATSAGKIADLEAQFENFENVENFVNNFASNAKDLIGLSKEIQKNSLTKTPEQEEIEPFEIKPTESISLSDIPFDNETRGDINFLKPTMKIYADAKAQLIKNIQPDGSSKIGDNIVRLSVVSTKDFEVGDFYPDTQSAILSGDPKIVQASKEGVVLAVTDIDGNLIRFGDDLTIGPLGKTRVIYYNLRKPILNQPFNEADMNLVKQLKDGGMSSDQATATVNKKLGLIRKVRDYVGKTSKSVSVNIIGGKVQYAAARAKVKHNISALNFKEGTFTPYKGLKTKNQFENVYYFDLPGSSVTMSVDSPPMPMDLVQKLIQLMTEEVSVSQGSKLFNYANSEKIKLFKQFIYTEPEVFDLQVDLTGNLIVKKLGVIINYPDKTAFAEDLLDLLSRKPIVKKITPERARGKTRVVNLKTALFNQVYEKVLANGNVEYYEIGQVQLKVNDTAFKNNSYIDFTLSPKGDVFTIKTEAKPYYPFIATNFLLGNEIDSDGNLQTTGSTLEFELAPEGNNQLIKENIIEKVPELFDEKGNLNPELYGESGETIITTPVAQKLSAKDKLLRLRKESPDKFNKLIAQKGLQPTLDQIDAAEKWYNNSPVSKYFPFETIFDVINQEDSNSIATWTTSGVTLYKGADYTDLYHEAWHGFTQGFLSPEDKTELYNETRKLSGTFQDYNGNIIKFGKATNLQLEEYHAEDFRKYMLSSGKTTGGAKRNSIFRRILNFLKQLFGSAEVRTVVNDKIVNKTIAEFYEKLRVGDLSEYTFSNENRNFNSLNKALIAIRKNEVEPTLSFENSNLIFNTVNSLFSEAIDVMNQANINDINERRDLQAKENLTSEEKQRLEELNIQPTSNYTTLLLSTVKGLKSLYDYTKTSLEEKYTDLKKENEKSPSTELQKKIDLLKYTLRNFGDIENLSNNKAGEGVVGYHLYKSDLIESEVFDELQEESELVDRELEGKNVFDRGGNESSIFDLANREVRVIIKSLNKTDLNGIVIQNQLGFPELVQFREAFAQIARIVQNSRDIDEMYSKLEAEQDIYSPIKQLLNKMGLLSYSDQTNREVTLWSKFYQTFNKYRIPLIQTTVNEQTQQDENGAYIEDTIYDIRIGNALADYKRIDTDWRADFSRANSNPLMLNDIKGNYLNLLGLLEKYSSIEKVNEKPLEFLNDIGIKMKQIPIIKNEVDKAIKAGTIRLSGIYNNLLKLQELGFTVRGMGAYLTNNSKNGIIGQTGQNSNYGKLLTIQSKYSGEYSDFMVQNAAGDPQSEFSQNSSLTQIVKQVNSFKFYNELVNNPATAHYNNVQGIPGRPFNPFINSSIWMNSLFNMNEFDGPRYDNEIVIENLSGINSSVNDNFFEGGIATAQADEVGKLLNDFHIQLMKFTPELTRHAGKKTSLAVSLRNYKTGSRNSKLYIDTEDFVASIDEFNQGFDNFYKILVKYIGAELDRVNYVKYLQSPEADVKEFDFNYLKRADKFVAFAGVLSDETKNALYNIKSNLSDYLNTEEGNSLQERIYDEVLGYFNNLTSGVETKMNEYNFISPSLIDKTTTEAKKLGKTVNDITIRKGLISSFVVNNWIHHFEEMIMLYGDIALYKDFFKRNASLNSTGDIVRNDPEFIQYVNDKLGKQFAKQAGVSANVLSYNGILNTAVVSDVLVKSVYLDQYNNSVKSPTIEAKYGKDGVNEADAQALITFDTYRIILSGLGKWTKSQEQGYQDLLAGKNASEINTTNFFPVLKMGTFGPIQNDYLPLTGLHKFALMPLIPGVIPENLQALHDKMMKEGIDYLTFESGSKVGTITGKSGLQPFYSNVNTRELNATPFVKNKVFTEYLKYQVEAAPYYKGKVTLMTQLRKLVELGLMENGIPTDYFKGESLSNREAKWDKLSELEKQSDSKNYKLRAQYLRNLNQLVEVKKSGLLRDIGWKRDAAGNLTGDMGSLLELVSNELKRSDVGEHEWAYIQTIKGKDIKNSLDISQSADMIEKVITSLVNKRLINIKVNGEQLVMVSTTGWEDKAFAYGSERNFDKPTKEELEKYGTNDLPTYHINDKGVIAAAKVKIAIQGNFKLLLHLDEVKEKASQLGITRLQALNLLLKDNTWLDQRDNRAMVTMVGARIPTQGPNSGDFVEVYEFFPEIAGNIIIAPPEVTSKSGTDFDYDKLPMLMPNLRWANGKIELAKKYTKEETQIIYDQLIKEGLHKMTFVGLSKQEIRALLQTSDRFEKVDQTMSNLLGPEYLEEMIKIVKEDTVKDFDTFYENWNGSKVIENQLINSIRAIMERADNFADLIRPNDTDIVKPLADALRDKGIADKQGTRMFEPLHNLKVQQANSIGKDTLGIGAISNTFNAVFNSVGMSLNPTYGTLKLPRRATLLFPHNIKDRGISLSGQFDAFNENNIADIVSQLINGWVDVEKDDWISYIQGNKEVAPVLLFMVQAGVPIKQVVAFVTQPLIRRYVDEQRLLKGNFAKALGKEGMNIAKSTARKNILNEFFILPNSKAATIYYETLALTKGIEKFDIEELKNYDRGIELVNDFDRAVFLHFLEIENMSREVDKVIRAFNVDTTTLQSLTEFYSKVKEVERLSENTLVPDKYIDRIKKNSPISPFYVQEFALELFGRLLPLRNANIVNEFISNLNNEAIGDVYDLTNPDQKLKFAQTFKNDLINYIFQNELRAFRSANKDFTNAENDIGELTKDVEFVNNVEREHFYYERKRLREMFPMNVVSGWIEFNDIIKENEAKDELKKEGENIEDFVKRLEELSYEEFLRDKALYNIFNPWQLFKSPRNVASTYAFILDKYPQLKDNFSLLNNVKKTFKDGFSNLMLSTMKLSKDEIDTFHENFKDLANSNKLLSIKDIDQRDADYISDFFGKLPLCLFMQTGPNTKNAFSFGRVMPQDKIVRILEKPVKEVTDNINEKYLEEFLQQFIVANSQKATRNRFKEFLKQDEIKNKEEKLIEKQINLENELIKPIKNTKNELQNIISRKSQVKYGTPIQAITAYLRAKESSIQSIERSKQLADQEETKLVKYITDNNLWYKNIEELNYIGEGEEQKVYEDKDPKYVIKLNDANFYGYWSDYLDSLLFHNHFFPDTAYELLGFAESDGIIYSVVKQPFIEATSTTDLNKVENFLFSNGFIRIDPLKNDYHNDELGLDLDDLHNENVLTSDNILKFIDTIFYTSEKFYETIRPKIISDDELNNKINQCK